MASRYPYARARHLRLARARRRLTRQLSPRAGGASADARRPSPFVAPRRQRRAFRELFAAITDAQCPRLAPTLLVDILPDVSKAAVYRAFMPRGSLRDLIHRVSEPLQPHGVKYGRAAAA